MREKQQEPMKEDSENNGWGWKDIVLNSQIQSEQTGIYSQRDWGGHWMENYQEETSG